MTTTPTNGDDFEQPTMNCPRCNKEYEDFDGFGVVYCAPPEGCGYCRHVARTGIGDAMVCDFCGDVRADGPAQGVKMMAEAEGN